MRAAVFALLLSGCCPVASPALPATCPSASEPPRPPTEPAAPAIEVHAANPLVLGPGSPYRTNPALRAKLSRSPHRYFRGVNEAFAAEVCRRFEKVRATLPIVNLHGDAHVEQVAVTDQGAGLSDFDDSVSGPPVIDLVRFGTSVALAAEQRGWPRAPVVTAFVDAYGSGVARPDPEPLPKALQRLKARFSAERGDFLSRADSLMAGSDETGQDAEEAAGWHRYVALMLELNPKLSAEFFRIKRRGVPQAFGIGSATTRRVLYRIEGATSGPNDDVILEAKEMRSVSEIPCIEGRGGLPVRIILNATRFGAKVDPFLAIDPRDASEDIDDPPWWIQSWWAHYAEIDVDGLESDAELREIAVFAANRLAAGHTGSLPAPYDRQLRVLLRDMLNEHRTRILEAIDALTQATLEAYAEFRR